MAIRKYVTSKYTVAGAVVIHKPRWVVVDAPINVHSVPHVSADEVWIRLGPGDDATFITTELETVTVKTPDGRFSATRVKSMTWEGVEDLADVTELVANVILHHPRMSHVSHVVLGHYIHTRN